ncbi:MAG: PIN domain-containing protein [Candidatus Schekmanbacteria bacterium]|nr:PIN domain-containing protein [Candidatus Schekmanbacteria bacterium]
MTNSTPASEFVTDTMGLILRIEQRKLSSAARTIFNAVEAGKAVVYIPALVLGEILYLSEKQKIGISLQDVADYLKCYPNYKEYPMNFAVTQSAAQIADIRELHDRLIAGTARLLALSLITNDSIIQTSAFVKTIW